MLNIDLLMQTLIVKSIEYYKLLSSDVKSGFSGDFKVFESKTGYVLADNLYRLKESKFITTPISVGLAFHRFADILDLSPSDYHIATELKNILDYFFGIYPLSLYLDKYPELERVICYYFEDCKLPVSRHYFADIIDVIIKLQRDYISGFSRLLALSMINNFINYYS